MFRAPLGTFVLTTCILFSAAACRAETRTWKDETGQFEVSAEMLEAADGIVKLRTDDGRELSVPLLRLSSDDRRYVREELRRRREAGTSGTAAVWASPSTSGAAGDWPQWRGPARTGVSEETGLLDSWPEEGPPLLWSARGLGNGYSSLAVVGDRIFTCGKTGEGAQILCLSRKDGSRIWAASLGDRQDPNGTPTVADGCVYGVRKHGN